jgi:hypothetical protein
MELAQLQARSLPLAPASVEDSKVMVGEEENGEESENLIILDVGPTVKMLMWPNLNYWGD